MFEKIFDLTHPLSPEVPTWNGSCGFSLEIKKDYDKMFRVQQIKMHAGVGTHMDAPSHCIPRGASIGQIPLETCIAPLAIIDISQHADADYQISLEDIKHYERNYGAIPPESFVVGFTGWCRFWNDKDAYRNVDSRGNMHFPSFSAKACEYLLEKEIVGLGIDTLSPDCSDATFPVHHLLLGKGKYIIENIADCSLVPPQGAYILALPLYAEEATEAPIRLLAVQTKRHIA